MVRCSTLARLAPHVAKFLDTMMLCTVSMGRCYPITSIRAEVLKMAKVERNFRGGSHGECCPSFPT